MAYRNDLRPPDKFLLLSQIITKALKTILKSNYEKLYTYFDVAQCF